MSGRRGGFIFSHSDFANEKTFPVSVLSSRFTLDFRSIICTSLKLNLKIVDVSQTLLIYRLRQKKIFTKLIPEKLYKTFPFHSGTLTGPRLPVQFTNAAAYTENLILS